MLTKLLKYDLKYMIKNMSVFYIFSIFFAITTRILFSVKQTVIIDIIGQISVGTMFSMLASVLINTLMRSWIRFRDSIYKDEAYLTHTLPVTKKDIYNSKFLQTLIFFIVGFVVIVLSLLIVYYTKDRWIALKTMINSITSGLNINAVLFVLSMIGIIFLEIFNAIQSGFFGIILGHKKNNNKIGYSVLFGFLEYMISQTMVLILMFIVGLFDGNIMELFKNNNILLNSNTLKLIIILTTILYLLIIYFMSVICKKELDKGVNIE